LCFVGLRITYYVRKRKDEAHAKRLREEGERKQSQLEHEKQANDAIHKKREHFRGLFQHALSDGFQVDIANNLVPEPLKSKVSDEKNNIEIAKSIEEALFKLNNNELNQEHARILRTLIYNLKDKKNSSLRKRIIEGDLPASKLVRLDSEELANQDIVKLRESQDKAALHSIYRERELVEELKTGIKVAVREEAPLTLQPRASSDPDASTSVKSESKPSTLRLSGSGSHFGDTYDVNEGIDGV
jgi:hypothetical protein